MSYTHFTIEERCCLWEFYKKVIVTEKLQNCQAETLVPCQDRYVETGLICMKCRHTIHTAQKKSNLRSSHCHRGMFWSQELIKYIEEKPLATWLPEQIANVPSPFQKMPRQGLYTIGSTTNIYLTVI